MWDKRFSSGFNLRIHIKNRNKRREERKRENNRIEKKNDDGDDDDKCLFVCRILAFCLCFHSFWSIDGLPVRPQILSNFRPMLLLFPLLTAIMSFNVFIDIIVLSCRLSLFCLPYIYIVTIKHTLYCNCNYSLSLSLSLVQNHDLLFMDSLKKEEK